MMNHKNFLQLNYI